MLAFDGRASITAASPPPRQCKAEAAHSTAQSYPVPDASSSKIRSSVICVPWRYLRALVIVRIRRALA